jgi:hypothetical protein
LNSFHITTSHMARYHVNCYGGSFIVCDWRYFLTCILAKTSVVTLALFFLGVFAMGRSKLPKMDKVFIFLPPLAFLAAASFLNRINIGVRHVLPVYPFLILMAGFSLGSVQRLTNPVFRKAAFTILAAGLGIVAVRNLSFFPNELAYFSEWVGGPLQGAAMTTDSNLDWGQDNRKVFALAKRVGASELKLGMTTGQGEEYNAQGLPWKSMTPEDLKNPAPGFYALDLAGYLEQRPGSWFYKRQPDYEAGATRYLFHVKE